jgi:hypothetical protein
MKFIHDLALDLAASDKNTWNRFGNDSETVRESKKLALRMRSATRTIQRTIRESMIKLKGRYRGLTKDEISSQLPPRPYIDHEILGRVPMLLPKNSTLLPRDYDYYLWKNPKTAYGRNARPFTYGMLKALVPPRSSVKVHYLVLYGPRYPDKDKDQTFQRGRTAFIRDGLQTITLRHMDNSKTLEIHFKTGQKTMYMNLPAGKDDDDDINFNIHPHEPYLIVFSTTILGQPIVKSHRIEFNSRMN